jgi:hypothetical protein
MAEGDEKREEDNPQAKIDNNFIDEWKTCRNKIDKFDKILVDLRKYGFSFVTGLTTAGSFLGFAQEPSTRTMQIGVIVVTMVLIVALYWLDSVFRIVFQGAILRIRFLEIFRVKRRLDVYMGAMYKASNLGNIVLPLYLVFVLALVLLGAYVQFADPISTGSVVKSTAIHHKPAINRANSTTSLNQSGRGGTTI